MARRSPVVQFSGATQRSVSLQATRKPQILRGEWSNPCISSTWYWFWSSPFMGHFTCNEGIIVSSFILIEQMQAGHKIVLPRASLRWSETLLQPLLLDRYSSLSYAPGRALLSDWSTNSFVLVVYERNSITIFCTKAPLKMFVTNQLEVSALLVACIRSMYLSHSNCPVYLPSRPLRSYHYCIEALSTHVFLWIRTPTRCVRHRGATDHNIYRDQIITPLTRPWPEEIVMVKNENVLN